ncbi:DUF3014 domain-containing protein [Alteromonas oceanisediminis]|uniref:DUF3014 domain-containing protein n=1 Tax=Alteromonas oceanisediminis TaxID=2836180 RepID=UPI001BDA9B4A|nr:DUF3014 domain-containing protein [Alteromonas oceanisediminis]MBT0587906.1 DUF3014 domain-containing protein [Alteromonas oceanisediminis]
MSNGAEQKKTMIPHIVLGAIFIAIIAVVLLWPASEQLPEEDVVMPATPPDVNEQPLEEAETLTEPEAFEPPPTPGEVVLDPVEDPEPQEPVIPDLSTIVDTSDAAIKSALLEIAQAPVIGRLLVNDSLLQRFVVNVTNLANEDRAPNHELVVVPEQSFRVYQQAGKEWIDPASYKRYNDYVEALETLDNDQLISLYQTYLPEIQEKYSEIGDPDKPFTDVFVNAIDELLDTPEIPTPVEVYSDSVTYKFADERIENLSEPQKQLLRTGPDNMRRIKAKLRELQQLLEDGSQ